MSIEQVERQDAPYELEVAKLPALTGWRLKFTSALLNSEIGKRYLVPQMLKLTHITEFRQKTLLEKPTYHPLPQSCEMTCKTNWKISNDSLLELIKPSTDVSFHFMTISDYVTGYKSHAFDPVKIVTWLIHDIKKSNEGESPLRAVTQSNEDEMLDMARESKRRWDEEKPLSILDGVPIAVKDELDVKGYATTGGTLYLGKQVAIQDAAVVRVLRDAGAIIIGKANMNEHGLGITGCNPRDSLGIVRNPYDSTCYAGGSSSGSAAAVASGLCPIALGVDGGGSIRAPAALCGIVGLKPTFDRVSDEGSLAGLRTSVCHVGPIGATVRDTALAFSFMVKCQNSDYFPSKYPHFSLENFENADLKSLKIGVFRPFFNDASPEIVQQSYKALDQLKLRGAEILFIDIPELLESKIGHFIAFASEACSNVNLDFYDSLLPESKMMLSLSAQLTISDYIKAAQQRTQSIHIMEEIFEKVDCIITPGAAITAPKVHLNAHVCGESNLEVTSELLKFMFIASYTGIPALTVPIGYSEKSQLPISLQIMASWWREDLLLRVGLVLENEWPKRMPQTFFRFNSVSD